MEEKYKVNETIANLAFCSFSLSNNINSSQLTLFLSNNRNLTYVTWIFNFQNKIKFDHLYNDSLYLLTL